MRRTTPTKGNDIPTEKAEDEYSRNGHPHGIVRRTTADLQRMADDLGCNPFEVMCMFAMNDVVGLGYPENATIDKKLRFQAAAEVSGYLYAKRKQIEVTGMEGGDMHVLVAMDPTKRRERIDQLINLLASSKLPVGKQKK